MRRLLYVCWSALLLPCWLYSQEIQDDFEGNGTIAEWVGDDCNVDDAFANPFPGGINSSATVLKYTDEGGTFANARFDVLEGIDLSVSSRFSLLIYVPSNSLTGSQPNQISLKLQNGTLSEPWSTQSEIIKPITLDEWQEVSFDFVSDPYINLDGASPAPVTRTDFNRVVLQVNGENNQELVVAYIDDVKREEATTGNGSIYTELIWSDEFDTDGPIDASKWYHQTQLPNGTSWYNGEVQHYTDRLANSYIQDGNLYIMAKRETFTDQGQTKDFTSARLNSKVAFTYGRVEVRAKMPFGVGTWPAIWMLGKNVDEPGGYWQSQFGTVGWPACGEIDIIEHWGDNQNFVQSALHTPSSFGATVNKGGLLANDVSNTFHVYAVEWTPEKMDFSLDGNVFYTYNPEVKNASTWPFDADQYILLNVAILPIIGSGFTQSPLVIDYVRVYQEATTQVADLETDVQLFPNPVEHTLQLQLPPQLVGGTLKVFTTTGQMVERKARVSSTLNMDWSAYPAGVYSVVVEKGQVRKAYKVRKE